MIEQAETLWGISDPLLADYVKDRNLTYSVPLSSRCSASPEMNGRTPRGGVFYSPIGLLALLVGINLGFVDH